MASNTYTHQQLMELWVLGGGMVQYADTAAAIAQAESGGCRYALAGPRDIRPVKACTYRRTSRENSCGLWQINLKAHPEYHAPAIFDPVANARAAVAVANGGADFSPWSTYTNGAYRNYLISPGSTTPQPGTGSPEPPQTVTGDRQFAKAWTRFMRSLAVTGPRELRRTAGTTRRLRKVGR